MTKLPALAVDVQGLAKLVERRGKSFAVLELVQNAWDEASSKVQVALDYQGYNKALLVVEDDSPEGFADLSHAFTLYAESAKKSDPQKRGRFNAGEKLVIALSTSFLVETTKGGVVIDVASNERRMLRAKRERGSRVEATLRMTRDEVAEAVATFKTLLPPLGIETFLNGEKLAVRDPKTAFATTLATEIADESGYLRPTRRMAEVEVFEVQEGEKGTLYEMGIPVVETGDAFHVNILQKVPLNSDRDNVTPAYLRDVRALVLNKTASLLDEEQAASNWVNEALEDDLVEADAVERVMTARFGDKRVIFDPSDPEANRIAMSQGFTVIPGRSLSGAAWKNVKRYGAALPAGQITPSPSPYSLDAEELAVIDPAEWTEAMSAMATFAKRVALKTLGYEIQVQIANDSQWPFNATYGESRVLVLNAGRLGHNWFYQPFSHVNVLRLLIHEFAHTRGAEHLSKEYDDNLARIGARLTAAALAEPGMFI